MGGRKTRIRHQPPEMGNGTRSILAEIGYTSAQIEDLVAQQVVIAGKDN
jgi:crotonobetainyl-CoA:carnitine CoA-transferase CaiB-like acyl-CoA transferase